MSLLSNFFGQNEEQQNVSSNLQIEKLAISILISKKTDFNHKELKMKLHAFDTNLHDVV